jgi:hypothetical protein
MTDHTDDDDTDDDTTAPHAETAFEFGGLRFEVSFRGIGPTLRVEGAIGGAWTEVLRFDDFVGNPHFHAPANGAPIPFDPSFGEPLEWFIAQVRDDLGRWLDTAGYGNIVPTLDFAVISSNADLLRQAMVACVPSGFTRVPGEGLRRSETSA